LLPAIMGLWLRSFVAPIGVTEEGSQAERQIREFSPRAEDS